MRLVNWRNGFIYFVIATALSVSLAGCARQDPLVNPAPVTVPDMSMEAMETAIFDGCAKRGWSPEKIQEGLIRATLYIREHTAVVDISYLPGRFTIKYVNSEKLNYGKDEKGTELIHPHYNDWVQYLKNDINVAMAKQAREYKKSVEEIKKPVTVKKKSKKK